MAIENALVYEFVTGDNTYPHSGTFTIGVAGQVSIDDSNGVDDATFGDLTHTGGADEPDQDVTASTVSGINATDTIDLRYKYTVTGSDGSSGTIHFIATNGAANYGPYFVSDFPLDPSVTYTFGTFNTDGAAPYASLVPCFTSGTWIETSKGLRVIDNLVEGDLIQTRDNGMQPLRWIGFSNVRATGLNAPIHIAQGALGNSKGLLVSPNHRILITAATADMYFGANEVLVASKLLLGNDGISKRTGGQVTYAHILFDQHEVVVANGTPSESFFPGQEALGTLSQPSRDEVLRLFPELRASVPVKFQKTARMCLNRYEATMLQQLM
jgi:hypothetical protein